MRALRKIKNYYRHLGIRGVASLLASKATGYRILIPKKIDRAERPLWLRAGTTDLSVYVQVFVERHYDMPISPAPEIIIDAGANIGLAAVFFALRYPSSTIIAIEPDAENFEVLTINATGYQNVKPLNSALWAEDSQLDVVDIGSGDHGFQTTAAPGTSAKLRGSVKALTISSIMRQHQLPRVDLLKIDIEGAEKEVFESSEPWINQVGTVMAEIHDHIKPGSSVAFDFATRNFGKEIRRGETIMRRKASLATPS